MVSIIFLLFVGTIGVLLFDVRNNNERNPGRSGCPISSLLHQPKPWSGWVSCWFIKGKIRQGSMTKPLPSGTSQPAP